MEHLQKEVPLYGYPLYHSTVNRAYVATTAFLAFLGEWMILLAACLIALFFFPLTPGLTLNSTSASVLNVTGENHFSANLGVGFLVDDSNPVGSTIFYDSLHVSLFHRQDKLSTFSLPSSFQQQEPPTKTAIQAKFPDVSVKIDEWGVDHGSCGFVDLELWFSAIARYTQPLWPEMRDSLQGHCGEVKVELCSSATDTIVKSMLASCEVYSAVVHKIRFFLFVLLIFLLVTAVAIPLLVEQFFRSSTFS